MDVIKMTAQFVARNGKAFLSQLSTREARNPQFQFLRSDHLLFSFFTPQSSSSNDYDNDNTRTQLLINRANLTHHSFLSPQPPTFNYF